MNYIAYDLETTGTDPETDFIVEIGAVRFEHFKPVQGYSTLVDPGCPIPPDAARVNGISDEMVKGQPTVDQVLQPFAEFCGDLPLVAHNAKFDFRFLERFVKEFRTPAPGGTTIDSFSLAKRVATGLPNYRLGTLIRFYNIPSSTFHRAEEDAAYCGLVFARLVQTLQANGELIDVDALVRLTGRKPMRFPVFKQESSEQLGLF